MTVDVTTTQNPVTVSVNDTNVSVSVTDNVTTATVSGGTGPQGPTGPQGDPASLTPATSTAIGGIIVGSGLSVTVNGTLSATGAVSSVAGRTGAVTLTTADVSGYTAPPVSSVAGRTGTVTLSTADISGYTSPPVTSVAGRTGTVTLTTSDIGGYTAPQVSSVAGRTGAVTLTTADVSGYTAPTVSSVAGRTGTVTLSTSDISGLGTLATQSGTFSGSSSGTNTGDQTITLTGDVTGTGTGSFSATLAASGATAGTYTSVTVDAKGRVTSGTNPSGYSLPTATASVLGGIKIGSGLSIDGSGVVSAASSYTLPDATTLVKGGVIVGSGLSVSSGTLSANVTSVAGRTGTVTIASGDVSGLAASATTNALNADNISSGTLPDARLSSAVALGANVQAMLGQYDASASTTYVETAPRFFAAAATTQNTGQAVWSFFTPLKTITINRIAFISSSAASGLTLARFALFTYDETTATLVARTDSDTTLFAAANTSYARALSTTGSYPSSYTLTAGTRYGVAVLQTGTTVANLYGCTLGAQVVSQVLPKMQRYVGGLSDLATINLSTNGAGNQGFLYARLYYV
jgi:hypothetical protein